MARPSQGIAGGQDAAGGVLEALERAVQSNEANGAVRATLGSCEMPDGYALMQDLEDGSFFWIRADGAESPRHYSRWEVWESANEDAKGYCMSLKDFLLKVLEDIPPVEWENLPDYHHFSFEKLVHFNCGRCKKWWSIGDAPEGPQWWCPWCGTKLSAKIFGE